MRKSSMLIVAMVMACFVITAVNSNNVLACDQCDGCEQEILKRVTQVKHILETQVLPRLGSVPKTGQTTSYGTGDDGDLQMGTAWANPRFTDNGNGTVTDNLTGLIWLKDANCFGKKTWAEALSDCNNLTAPDCGLSDGSVVGDWRLPNVRELHSLVHYDFLNPALPDTAGMGQSTEGDPFTNTTGDYIYWTSTTTLDNTAKAFYVDFGRGSVFRKLKTKALRVWPVRGP